jgi:hypothetical protein
LKLVREEADLHKASEGGIKLALLARRKSA